MVRLLSADGYEDSIETALLLSGDDVIYVLPGDKFHAGHGQNALDLLLQVRPW